MRHEQAKLRCALPGFPERQWGPTIDSYHMGALPVLAGPVEHSETPPESHEDGCPGAWYRCGFVSSLLPYERSVSEGGGYSENLRLSRCTDPLVLDAIQYLEHERARARSHQRERMTPT